MFPFLHSIFNGSEEKGSYPESLVKAAIERAVDGTDPWLRAVSGYQKKLRPAVLLAITHVVGLVDSIPPPAILNREAFENSPQMRAFFISGNEVEAFIAKNKRLAEFRKNAGDAREAHALLFMEKREAFVLGAELVGEIIMTDVPLMSVSFASHQLVDPCGTETELRRKLKIRAFDHLLGIALKRITAVKTERGNLERYRALLEAKLNLLTQAGWGFGEAHQTDGTDLENTEELLGKIETQLNNIGSDDEMLAKYLDCVIAVLSNPADNLWAVQEKLTIDRMGIKRSAGSADAPELLLNELCNAEGRCLVCSPVIIPIDTA